MPVAGILSALVPGMVEAALVTLREFGTKSFAEAVEPAIELADGFPLDEMRVDVHSPQREVPGGMAGLQARLPARTAACRSAGDIFRQPDLARTLRSMVAVEKKALAAGRQPRRRPSTPCATISTAAKSRTASTSSPRPNGGLLRYEDMAAFHVEPEDAVSTTFHGYTVYKPGFWSQGPAMIEALNILEGFDLARHEAEFGRLHPHAGGSAEAGLCGSRHLLRRPAGS